SGLPPAVPELLVVATLAGYGVLLVLPRERVLAHVQRERTPQEAGDVEVEERAREREADRAQGFPSGWHLLIQGLLATAVGIAGCAVLVNATLYLGPRLGLPAAITGTFALAALTSLPNVWVAVSLVARRRGAVLVSAVCNSNTINAVFGICVPALFIHLRTPA